LARPVRRASRHPLRARASTRPPPLTTRYYLDKVGMPSYPPRCLRRLTMRRQHLKTPRTRPRPPSSPLHPSPLRSGLRSPLPIRGSLLLRKSPPPHPPSRGRNSNLNLRLCKDPSRLLLAEFRPPPPAKVHLATTRDTTTLRMSLDTRTATKPSFVDLGMTMELAATDPSASSPMAPMNCVL
jgi:hypothetical protein